MFIMLIGIPASGKDTWAENYISTSSSPTVMCSSDKIREELYGDERIQGNPAEVFRIMEKRSIEFLKEGYDVIYNATNVSYKNRKGILSSIRKNFPTIFIKGIVFATPIEKCKEWNQARERVVPDYVYDRMLSRWQTPFFREGFDRIEIVNVQKGMYYFEEIVNKVKNFGSQQNPHHSLSLWEHCQKCGDIASNVFGVSSYPVLAAAIHDYGKIYTQSFDENGIAHYYSHENYSGYLALSCGCGLKVAQLANYHMLCYNKDTSTWRERLGEELWHDLEIIHKCDKEAH